MRAGTAITIRLKNRLSELERVSRLVAEFAAQHQVPAPAAFDLAFAIDEVLTNVISYAYTDDQEHDIIVRLSQTAGELDVEVEDDGRPFDPLSVAEPRIDQPLEHRPVGGLGLHLVRAATDNLEYRREDGKNVLTIHKRVG
jgi:anti-sigma regulatory factor (Ser/Thr protein kinase)